MHEGRKDEKNYLEAKNAANEEQHDEDQAHITKSSDLFFVGEVIRLQGIWKKHKGQKFSLILR